MFRAVQATLDRMTADLDAGHFAALVAQCDFPFVLQIEDELSVLHSPVLAMAAWKDYATQRRPAGVVQSQTRIVALELPRRSRFRVWAEVLHLDATGVAQSALQVIHHFRDRGHWFCLEMLTCSARAVPGHIAGAKPAADGQPAAGTLA